LSSVPDPDPDPDLPDTRVFWPPGSGSGSFYHHAKIIRKTLNLFDVLSLKNNVNVPSKINKQKKMC
jgi:hypothetical protein